MKNSRLIKWVGAAVLAIPLALGIAHADARNNVLAIGVPVEPVTLDPANGFTGFDYPFLYSLYDRLIDFEPKTLKLRPGLATAWRFIGNDQRAFEISLRPNVKFHDKTPLDAEAVKASLLRFKEIGLIRDLDPVVSIDVIDPLKLVLRLSSSYSVLPAILADPVADEADRIEPAHILLLQEIDRVAVPLGKQRDQHIGAGDHILARTLHMQNGALDHPLEPGCRLRIGIVICLK